MADELAKYLPLHRAFHHYKSIVFLFAIERCIHLLTFGSSTTQETASFSEHIHVFELFYFNFKESCPMQSSPTINLMGLRSLLRSEEESTMILSTSLGANDDLFTFQLQQPFHFRSLIMTNQKSSWTLEAP